MRVGFLLFQNAVSTSLSSGVRVLCLGFVIFSFVCVCMSLCGFLEDFTRYRAEIAQPCAPKVDHNDNEDDDGGRNNPSMCASAVSCPGWKPYRIALKEYGTIHKYARSPHEAKYICFFLNGCGAYHATNAIQQF